MSWYDEAWARRQIITVDNSAAAGGTYDVTVPIPPDWDDFWGSVDATGDDVRVTTSDGVTPVTFDLDVFDTSARTGTIELDNVTLLANQATAFFVYYNNASAATAVSSFSPSTPKTGAIALDAPPETYTLAPVRARPGATTPADQISKGAAEEIDIFLDVEDWLQKRKTSYEGSLRFEEIKAVNLDVQTGGVSEASAFDETLIRIFEHSDGRQYVRLRLKGGASGTDYVVIPKITTSLSRVLEPRFLMLVQDLAE